MSRIGLFPFFEAHSQNCGSFSHGYALVIMSLTSPTWRGFEYLQNSSKSMIQNIIYSSGRGTKCPWLNCYYFVSFDCFPLFQHVITYLTKFISLSKVFLQMKGRQRPWGGKAVDRVLLCFSHWSGMHIFSPALFLIFPSPSQDLSQSKSF